MRGRFGIVGLLVVFVAGVAIAIGVPRDEAASLVLKGQVTIAPGPDGRLLVLIDSDTGTGTRDGLVEHAFRLQGAPSLTYSGRGTITYVRNRVTVKIDRAAGWAFTVTGWPMPPPDPVVAAFDVTGLAHLWGANIHQPASALFSTLLATSCSRTASAGTAPLATFGAVDCLNCTNGGPGVGGCTIDCSLGACEANCGAGSYACCTCGNCGCCMPPSELGGSNHH